MKVCILGSGLTSLALAKTLVNLGIKVDIIYRNNQISKDGNRTLAISKSNIEFFCKNILDIKNFLWNINKIEIYSEKLNNEKILDFGLENEQLFSIVKNHEIFDLLLFKLRNNKLVNFRNKDNCNFIKNYKLVINCDFTNPLTKKFFYNKLEKDYDSRAYTSIIRHKKISNNVAYQTFTFKGPMAFLPISKNETSVVYSVRGNEQIDLSSLIKKFNKKYEILEISKETNFKLKSLNLRTYYNKNILAFGDLLHKLHPLAGQGFNMSIRDIRELSEIIKTKLENGLDFDSSICIDFEKNVRHKNYIFSNSIDFVYEFFNFENKIDTKIFTKSLKFIGNNEIMKKFFIKVADKGIEI